MGYEPSETKWIKINKTFSDFSAAALTNTITIYSLPAKQMIHATQIIVTTSFAGGSIVTYTISVGIGGNNSKYVPPLSVAPLGILAVSTSMGLESTSGSTNIQATATSTIGSLNAATQGSVDIYLLISNLP
jgi:hypothetical protein